MKKPNTKKVLPLKTQTQTMKNYIFQRERNYEEFNKNKN